MARATAARRVRGARPRLPTRAAAPTLALALCIVACGDDGSGSGSGSGGEGGGPCEGGCGNGGGAGGLPSRDCTASAECPLGEMCEFTDDRCGVDGFVGTCIDAIVECTMPIGPVCGCDGNLWDNRCAAREAGVDVSVEGGCTPPMGTFACGPTFCETDVEYCVRTVSDVGASPDGFACVPLPDACTPGMPDCACIGDEPCGDVCEVLAPGEISVTCPGG